MRRQRRYDALSEVFFISEKGTASTIQRWPAGLPPGAGSSALRPSMMHVAPPCMRYAIPSLSSGCADGMRAGADVRALLPTLSVYLGHVRPQDTYWYLSATQNF